ncbi:hypothetical protein JAAARDRAFT_153034 [Jaapia argillacea MUCL 33604]|uniref:Transmembrane protein n=2 Tax=Jaapia argillacea MUCL 33604 TaxID=933084 RepID=A0A067QA97_9AGAM|nr:hypothetical protein JAAARDRAFT_153034 [Jaapia argillacea MUCL 33604]
MSPFTFFESQRSTTSTQLEIIDISQPSTLPVSLPAPPRAVATHSSSHSQTFDPIDDFFGTSSRASTSSRGTHDSRHDDGAASTFSTGDIPPPYEPQHHYDADVEMGLPAYDSQEEPATLAMYLFKYGFLFPPFWLLGAIILFLSLSAPSDFHPHKTEQERNEMLDVMRKTEVKWGRRCAVALLVLLLVVGVVVGLVVSVKLGV